MEYTFFAPDESIQSVKPPVEAPMSIHILSVSSIGKNSIALSSLSPPRLTYLRLSPLSSIGSAVSNFVPGLSSLTPSTKIFPSIMRAFALSLDSAIPLFTTNTSSLSFANLPLRLHGTRTALYYALRVKHRPYRPDKAFHIHEKSAEAAAS